MAIERPDWNYDNSGQPAEPAAPVSHQELVTQIANSDGPAPQDAATAVANYQNKPRSEVGTPATTVSREVARNPKDWSYDNKGNERPRDPTTGQFLANSTAELRQTWEREGGYAKNAAAVMAVEATILSASADATALQAHVATLPKDIQLKAADVMRLTTAYGPNGGADKWMQFENSLTPTQVETFKTWWNGLSRGDQDNILGAISK